MLTSQQVHREANTEQGRSQAPLDELRDHLARPTAMDEANRQRLMVLANRLARVQALGGEFCRVAFSPEAAAACRHVGVGPA